MADEKFLGNGDVSTPKITENEFMTIDFSQISKKKILLFSHEFSYTGAPHSLLRIAKILKKKYYLEVCSPFDGPFKDEFTDLGLTVHIIPYDDIHQSNFIHYIANFDLAIVNTIVPYTVYTLLQKFCPTIWYIREAMTIDKFCKADPNLDYCFRNAEKLYTVSEYAQKYIVDNYNHNVQVIRNCVEDETYREKYHRRKFDGIVNIIQIGTFVPSKGNDVMIDAFLNLPEKYLKKAHLYLAGQTYESLEDYWGPLLKRVNVSPYATFLGEIKNIDDKIFTLSDMDVVSVVSRDESCSLVVLEGAMMSKALIVSENVGAKYMVTEKNGWIVKTGDVEDLSKALMDAIDKSTILHRMGKNSRKTYDKLSNMKIYKKNILKLITDNLCDLGVYRSEHLHD